MSSVRHIYETAFDSNVDLHQDGNYLDDLVQSPVVCGLDTNMKGAIGQSTPNISAKPSTNAHFQSTIEVHRGSMNDEQPFMNQLCRSRRPKTLTTTFSSYHSSHNETSAIPIYAQHKKYHTEGSLQSPTSINVKESLPCRPKSDPLDRRKTDLGSRIGNSSATTSSVFHLPLNEPQHRQYESTTSSKTFSPSTEFKKLDVGGEKEQDPLVKVDSETEKLGNVKDNLSERRPEPLTVLEDNLKDRPPDVRKTERDRLLASIKSKNLFVESSLQDVRGQRDDMKRNHTESMPAVRQKLSLDFSLPSKRPRRHILDFWTPGHDSFHDMVDPSVDLENQSWYHGYISRKDAEIALRFVKEGSFLIRCCQNIRKSYVLSLKSANGVMHIKITQSVANGRFAMKQTTRSFDSIPEMIHYFTVHSLPVYGLEHVTLKHPIISTLL